MSFSSQIKEELSKMNNLSNKELVKSELIGYLISSNINVDKSSKIKYSTESDYNINRFSKLLNNVNILDYEIDMQGKSFIIKCNATKLSDLISIEENQINMNYIGKAEENDKALVRGVFLGAGSVNNPKSKYHLEISLSTKKNAEFIYEVMKKYEINLKKIKNKKEYLLYLKDGEEISKFLAFIGANKAVMTFEEIRVQREMNNKVNRLVNCETANLNKTINAAVEQIEAINYLKSINKFDMLSENLKEIANARVKNPNMPLAELGTVLNEPVGKSGVNYRLKKIVEIADDYKAMRE